MAIKKFNSIDGFSVGSDTPIAVIDNVANVTANSLVVSNKSNLGNVGNITITGGSAGYVLKTDGAGNLSWGIDTSAAGGSNTDVQFNDGGSLTGNSNFTFNKTTSVLTLTGNLVTTNANLGNLATSNYFIGNGSLLSSITGANVTGYVSLSTTANTAGTVTTNAQPNITSVGELTSLTVTSNINAGNANLGNLATASYFSGNGSLLTYIVGSNVSGNVTYAITSNWSNTANSVSGTNVSGQVGNALIAGTVYTNAQPNITSLGTLTNLGVTGNVTVGNLSGANLINANYFTGIVATAHQPNIESVGNLVGLTVSNVYGLVDFNTTANVSLGDISNLHITGGSTGYVLTTNGYGDLSWEAGGGNAGPGFVSIRKDNFVGNGVQTQFSLTAVPNGEDAVEVNLNGLIQQGYVYDVVGSNIVFTTAPASGANIEITTFGALTINQTDSQILFISGSDLTGSNNFTFTESNNTLSVNNVSTTANVSAGNVKTDSLLYANGSPYVFTTSASGSNTQVQFNDSNMFAGSAAFTFDKGTNTLSVTNIVANGSGITYITGSNVSGNVSSAIQSHYANIANSVSGSNVTGQVGNALIAGTVYTNAQPNITSVGTLTSLNVTGNVSANYFIGDGSLLTNINAGNITGAYSNTNVAAYLPTYTGNVSANYFIGNGSTLTYIIGSNVIGNVTSAIQSHYANTANSVAGANVSGQVSNALIAGTVYTASQPNITSVGTLLGLSVTGNLDITGNINATGNLNYSNVNDLVVGDPLIYLGANNTGNLYDLGFVASYNDGTYYHTGLARDATDGTWKLFDQVVAEPTTVIDFANGTYAPFKSGAILSTGNISGTNANLGNLVVANYYSGDGSLLTNINAGNITGAYSNANVAAYLPTYTGNVSANYFIGNGSSLTYIAGSNIVGNVTYAITSNWANTANSVLGTNVSGNVADAVHAYYADTANSVSGSNVTGQVGNALIAGTVYTNAQPNITSVGTLTSLSVSSNVSANYFIGDGSLLTNINAGNITGAYSNTNVAAYLPTYTGNVSANYFIGNGSALTNITGSNVTGNVTFAITSNWANTANSVSGSNVSGNVDSAIQAQYANIANSVTGSNVSGNVNFAITSNWANVANSVAGSNVSGQVGNALIAGTVYTNAQPNITSLGSLSNLTVAGDATITGNLIVSGNTNYINVDTLVVQDPIIEMGGGVNGAPLTNNDGKDRGSLLHYYTTAPVDAFMGWDNSNGEFAFGSNVSVTNEVVTVNTLGNIRAGYFIGNGALLTGLPTQYANSNVANYLPTYTGNVSANYFIGDGSLLTNINAGNITGAYSNANVANYLPTYTGNISGNYLISNALTATRVPFVGSSNQLQDTASLIWDNPNQVLKVGAGGTEIGGDAGYGYVSATKVYSTSLTNTRLVFSDVNQKLVDSANLSFTGTQLNVIGIANISGNILSSNANLGNAVVANYFIGDGSLLTGLPAQYANSNVANYLPTYTGNVSANYFIGNGSALTYITGSNVTGNVTFAITSNWANTANSVSGSNVTGNVAEAVHAYYSDIANSVSGSNVSGNVDFAITSNWSNIANSVSGSNVSGAVANATYATSAGSADSANTAGTVTTAAQPNITSTGTLTGLTVDGLTDLGPIGNITITGGTSGYVLTTNGAGDLSWQAAGGSAGPGFVNITKNSFTGNGVQTVFTLTTTPASEASLLVNIDGITQQDSAYSLSGSDVTFATAPFSGEIVEIVSYGSIGIGSNTTVLFNDNGDIGNVASFSFNKGSNTLSVTNIDTTTVTFDTGVITVAGSNAGIFTTGVDNINLGLVANVTVGSSSGNTTIQGNLIAGNISTSGNVLITGTATISNLKINDLYSNRTPVSVTTNTIVDSFPVNRYRSAKYTMRVNSDDGYQAVEVLLIHDGSTSFVTIYGSLSTIGTDIVTLSSNILSGSVRLLATTGSANTTVNLLGTYVAD